MAARTNEQNAAYARRWRRNNPIRYILQRKKSSAREKGIKFAIDEGDIVIPTHCPVTGRKLLKFAGRFHPDTLTLDRVNPKKGYIKGNVRVISWKANKWKSDMTSKDVRRLFEYVNGR